MRKIIYALFCVLTSFFGFSQQLAPEIIDTNKNDRGIYLEGSIELSSTALPNEILNPFLFGGEITNQVIDRNASKQKGLNRAGAIIHGNIMYRDLKTNLFKSEKIGFGVQLGYERMLNASYTKELFGLVFQGNEQYAGQNINLNSTSVADIGYQKMGFGVFLKNTQSYGFLNIINVSDYMKGGVKHGTIQQSEDLDDISLDLAGNWSRTTSNGYARGLGLSIDFKYNIPIKFFKNKTAIVSAQVKNLGFAYIYKGTQKYSMDTILHYNGFSFNQLIDGVISKETSLIDTLGIHEEKGTAVVGLPFYLQIAKEINEDYEGKLQSTFGIRVYPISNYKPMIYAGIDYKPISNLHLGLLASYGGYSTFRGSLYIQYKIKNFGFGISSDNIVGIVSKKQGFGQTYNIRLQWNF